MKIGILGGIGPEATGYFYSTLINKLKKSGLIKKNKDYPQFFINSINAPELTGLKVSNSDIQPYIDGIKELAVHKPDFIVMVCNTIHVYRDLIIQKSGFSNILSLKDIVKEGLVEAFLPLCILATPSTIKNDLYRYNEFSYVDLDAEDLAEITKIVVDFNATGEKKKNKEKLMQIIKKQTKLGAKSFLMACTEISELLVEENNFQKMDSLEILLNYVFKKIVSPKSL